MNAEDTRPSALPVANESAVPQQKPGRPDREICLGLGEWIVGHTVWKGHPTIVFTPAKIAGAPGSDASAEIAADEFSTGAIALRFSTMASMLSHLDRMKELGNLVADAVEEITSLEAAPSQRGSPNPVSEEEIADIICNCFNGDMTFNECAKLVISRLSRTEGEWRPDPKTVDACAQQAEMCSVVIDDHDERGRPMMNVSNARRTIAAAIRSLLDQSDPEESIRTRLDEQHVKSSGGVRTSTGKE